jgi:16S rRNA (cytidine1402-2'-O)-methyltransferase
MRPEQSTLVFYEAPHRIEEALADLEKIFGPKRRLVIVRELTKVHEEFLRGTVSEVSTELAKRGGVRGEITLIVAGNSPEETADVPQGNLIRRLQELMSAESLDEKAALKQVAKEFGISRSEAYREWQRKKATASNR